MTKSFKLKTTISYGNKKEQDWTLVVSAFTGNFKCVCDKEMQRNN